MPPQHRVTANSRPSPDTTLDASAFEFDPATFALPADEPVEPGPDPFDPEALRLSADVFESLGVQKVMLTISVRKPSKEWFIRTHPDPDYRLQTMLLELKEDREIYLLDKTLWPGLTSESTIAPRLLVPAVNRQGVLFVWPIRLPDSSGRTDAWSRSALDAAELAGTRWVRVQANTTLGAYEVTYAPHVSDPTWPQVSLRDLLHLAFRDHHITSRDHPVLRHLRGDL